MTPVEAREINPPANENRCAALADHDRGWRCRRGVRNRAALSPEMADRYRQAWRLWDLPWWEQWCFGTACLPLMPKDYGGAVLPASIGYCRLSS
jgi:hypothetical protein